MAAKKKTAAKWTTKKAAGRKTGVKKNDAKKTTGKRSGGKQPATKSGGKMSQIDAAVKVLEQAKVPLDCKTMVERMAKNGY